MPPGSPASPILEATSIEFDEAGVSIPYAKSDSNLARLNGEANRHRVLPPRQDSDEKGLASDSSSSKNGERRHISFNHRVEQCIAVDSTEEAKKYSSTESSGSEDEEEEDGDDEDDVLTFKSSPRVATFGPAALLPRQHHRSEKEPHTIARLGPTTLKSVEIWPAPSPKIYYHDSVPEIKLVDDVADGAYGEPTATYTARPVDQSAQARQSRRALYDYVIPTGDVSQWDEDEDYAMGFDYFNNGSEIGIADEYDMAQYGSTHLVSGAHNNYLAGDESYLIHGPYSPTYAPGGLESPSLNSNNSSPAHSRRTSAQDDRTSPIPPAVRGPHAPPPSSKDAISPKRSILKNRSRQSSDASIVIGEESPTIGNARFGGTNSPLMIVTPDGSAPSSPSTPSTISPQISPRSSASSLAAVMASAGIPSTIHLRETSTGIRRVDSNEVVREARGRSTSRGSSSSLERSASADRRTGASISPSSSYSPPVFIPPASGSRLVGPSGSRSRTNSSDSLNSLGATLAGARELMPDVPEASSESEAETVKESGTPVMGGGAVLVEDVEDEASIIEAIPLVVDGSASESIGEARSSNSPSRAILPAANSPSIANAAPRYRQPSPGATTTSTIDDEGYTSEAAGTPEPEDPTSIPSGSEETPIHSNARRSLLRASRGGGTSADREGSIGRSSIESGRGSHDDSYGFGYYDEDSDAGIVSRTLEVAGTVRDLIGALGRGIWSSRKEPSSSGMVKRDSK